jgi:hypothetical protein
VSVACPECRAPLVEGALRCKICNADAREAKRGATGAAFTLFGLSPRASRGAELLDELALLAPATLDEFRRLDRPRKERLVAILAELMEVTRKP